MLYCTQVPSDFLFCQVRPCNLSAYGTCTKPEDLVTEMQHVVLLIFGKRMMSHLTRMPGNAVSALCLEVLDEET